MIAFEINTQISSKSQNPEEALSSWFCNLYGVIPHHVITITNYFHAFNYNVFT